LLSPSKKKQDKPIKTYQNKMFYFVFFCVALCCVLCAASFD